jgi:hypothetical protein
MSFVFKLRNFCVQSLYDCVLVGYDCGGLFGDDFVRLGVVDNMYVWQLTGDIGIADCAAPEV